MIIVWGASKFLGGWQASAGVTGHVWNASFIKGADIIITLFDGVTTCMRLTGVGH